MIVKEFTSNNTKDTIEFQYFKKSHKANMYIKLVDDVSENIKLLGEAMTFLKNNGFQWICVNLKDEPKIPENTVWFKHEKSGNICCHIEDFDDFYLKNFMSMINFNQIYLGANKTATFDGGWTLVVDKKKLRKNKMDKIGNEINALIGNWNDL